MCRHKPLEGRVTGRDIPGTLTRRETPNTTARQATPNKARTKQQSQRKRREPPNKSRPKATSCADDFEGGRTCSHGLCLFYLFFHNCDKSTIVQPAQSMVIAKHCRSPRAHVASASDVRAAVAQFKVLACQPVTDRFWHDRSALQIRSPSVEGSAQEHFAFVVGRVQATRWHSDMAPGT